MEFKMLCRDHVLKNGSSEV